MKYLIVIISLFLSSLNAQAANCFWVGGSASLTPVNAASWASSSGGSPSTCAAAGGVPATSSDTATFDSSSGGGTIILNFGGTWTINSITINSFTGTWDNSVNNNNINFAGAASTFSMVGSGTRTINLGSAQYFFAANAGTQTYSVQGATNLTFMASSSTIVFDNDSSQRTIGLGNKTHGSFTFGPSANNIASYYNLLNASAGPTITSLNIQAPNLVIWPTSAITVITNTVNWLGSFNAGIAFSNVTLGIGTSINVPIGSTGAYMSFRETSFVTSGGNHLTCTNCVNSSVDNVTFVSGGSTTACILGGWLLWRDLPEHLNDNYPAWLEKAG